MPFGLPAHLPFSHAWAKPAQFFDPGPLIDQELQLIPPAVEWIDAVLAACRHPLSMQETHSTGGTNRQNLEDFLESCPGGHQQGDVGGAAAGYCFWMRLANNPQLPIGGGISLRLGNSYDTVMYAGHIGYHVYPPARGHHYAERACRLLFPLAKRHGIDPLWITCDPDNHPSRRTCQRLGGNLVEIVPVPEDHLLYQRGEKEKCRYRIDWT